MSHMTQTANPVTLLASPLGEEGHKVAKGWTVVILIMILDVDVTAEGGIIKLIAREGNPPPFEPFEPSHCRCVQWRQPRPFFIICGVSRHHNPRPERPSNLRTLRTLRTLSPFGTAYHLPPQAVGQSQGGAVPSTLTPKAHP